MPVNLHILTGKAGSGLGGVEANLFTEVIPLHHPIQIALTAMLTSGVFERHPDLTVVSVENDIGWLAHFLFRLDHFFDALRYVVNYSDPLTPTEYFRRNVLATFQDDPVGVATCDFIGADRSCGPPTTCTVIPPGPTHGTSSSETSRASTPKRSSGSRTTPSPRS